MDLFEAIRARHSYRGTYTSRSVPREDLRAIVETGIRAPSGHNAQTTSFVIVDDPDLLSRVVQGVGRAKSLADARALIAVVMDPRPAAGWDIAFGVEDCAAAVENMLLAITALGYASVWIDGDLRKGDTAARIAGLLGIPEPLQVRVVLPVGVPADPETQRKKAPFTERAFWNRYGALPAD